MSFYVGLDLGQSQDYTALAVVEDSGPDLHLRGLERWPLLREELLTFRRKVSLATGHDTYEHWRESDHDDLVLACALACWWARRVATRPRPTAIAAPTPFGTRRPRPEDPPRYLGGEGRFVHSTGVEQEGKAPPSGVGARGSGPLFRPEDF